jgi:hypothetical protein
VVSAARADLGNWDELSWGARIVDYLWHITLPVTAMVLGSFAVTAMLTKNSFLEEIRKQYVLTARAKGLGERQVLWKHVFRNALIPIITGLSLGLHRRLLHRLAADRDAVLARRPGPAQLRERDPARLPGGAGHAVPLHADRPGDQADPISATSGWTRVSSSTEGASAEPSRRGQTEPAARAAAVSHSPGARLAPLPRNRLGFWSLVLFTCWWC